MKFKKKKITSSIPHLPCLKSVILSLPFPPILIPLFFRHMSSLAFTCSRPFAFSILHPPRQHIQQYCSLGSKKKKRNKQRLKEGGLQPMSIPVVSEVTAAQWSHWQQRCTLRSAHAGMWDIVMVQSDRNGSRRVTARPLNTLVRCWYFWTKRVELERLNQALWMLWMLCHCTQVDFHWSVFTWEILFLTTFYFYSLYLCTIILTFYVLHCYNMFWKYKFCLKSFTYYSSFWLSGPISTTLLCKGLDGLMVRFPPWDCGFNLWQDHTKEGKSGIHCLPAWYSAFGVGIGGFRSPNDWSAAHHSA